jgi:hypothetical protein
MGDVLWLQGMSLQEHLPLVRENYLIENTDKGGLPRSIRA